MAAMLPETRQATLEEIERLFMTSSQRLHHDEIRGNKSCGDNKSDVTVTAEEVT